MLKFADHHTLNSDLLQSRSSLNGASILEEIPVSYSLTPDDNSFMVRGEKEKPESRNSGSKTALTESIVPSIIADLDLPASDKDIVCHEAAMAYKIEPHIRPPRCLMDDCRFMDARLEHQILFIRFIHLAAYVPFEHNINGESVKIQVGQLCYSLRKLAQLCGKRCTLGLIRGAIRYFEKVHFLTHSLTHDKSVITITHKETYDLLVDWYNTKSNTDLTQTSHTNREDRELRERRKKKRAASVSADRNDSSAALRISFSFESRRWENILPEDIDGWRLAYPATNVHVELQAMAEWLMANPTKRKSNYRAFIVRWLTKSQDKSPIPSTFSKTEIDRRQKKSDGNFVDNPLRGIF